MNNFFREGKIRAAVRENRCRSGIPEWVRETKEPKWYFYQWTLVENPGTCFENYLAVQLAAACSSWSEQGHGRFEVYYLRDQDRREVDFMICKDLKPLAIIEAKSSLQSWPSSLVYYCRKLQVPGFLVYPGDAEAPVQRKDALGWSVPSSRFLPGLILD